MMEINAVEYNLHAQLILPSPSAGRRFRFSIFMILIGPRAVRIEMPGTVHDIAVVPNKAFVAYSIASTDPASGVAIFDVSTPDQPMQLGAYTTSSSIDIYRGGSRVAPTDPYAILNCHVGLSCLHADAPPAALYSGWITLL